MTKTAALAPNTDNAQAQATQGVALAPNTDNAQAQATRSVALDPHPDARRERIASKTIAYYCAEYALDDNLPSFAGGLGVLAGDLFFEAVDQGLNWNLVSLFYNCGFRIDEHQICPLLNPGDFGLSPLSKISCPLANRAVKVQIWKKSQGSANIFLLDTNLPENSDQDRNITRYLYGPDDLAMFLQQIILGFGSIELFKILNVQPDVYHLNEGHTAITILALAVDFTRAHPGTNLQQALTAVKSKIVATKHTILPSAGLHIPWELPRMYLGPILESAGLSFPDLILLAAHKTKPELFSTTQLLLSFAEKSSAVSLSHAKFEKDIHPDSPLIPITNGIYAKRWQTPTNKQSQKQDLANYLNHRFGVKTNPAALTLIWARRLAAYKRPHLLFSNPTRLGTILNLPNRPVQILIAGKASVSDPETRAVITEIKDHCQESNSAGRVIFLPEYNLNLAKKLVSAADVWLNTPLPGKEASGTSGMKAGLNGALQFSTADGWIAENDWTNIGWILFEENITENLYDTIEKEIVPLYFDQPEEWAKRVQMTKLIVAQHYLTSRVLKDYFEKLYSPASQDHSLQG